MKTFKEFFSFNFKKENGYKNFSLINEMAERFHQMNSKPVNFDSEDLTFLRQFPHEFWDKAKMQRYNMLFDKLKKLHNYRNEDLGMKNLEKVILKAIETKDWDHLKGVVPNHEIQYLIAKGHQLNNKEKSEDAQRLAYNHIRGKTPHIDDHDEVTFTFPKNKILAKPYLNRLYHKLETNIGEPFHADSGLVDKEGNPLFKDVGGVGRYGFDLTNPLDEKKIKSIDEDGDEAEVVLPKSTSGLKFPNPKQMRERMAEFFKVNSHRIFGDLPKDAIWLPVDNKKDTWSANYIRNQIEKKLQASLRVSGKKFNNEKDLRKEAADLAKKEIIRMAEAGELKGPPIPGHPEFADGIPVRVKTLANGEKALTHPPLYLPFEKRDIKYKAEDGTVRTEKKYVPIVNPAHYFRELGSDPSDYETETDENGKQKRKYDADGNPIYNVPKEKLRGYEGQYVHMGDDEYKRGKDSHMAPGALHLNKDTEETYYMTKGDPRYPQAKADVFDDQELVDEKGRPGGQFYKDIIDGIKQCLSGKCGGATTHELNILRNNIADFHSLIVVKMLRNLGDPELKTPGGRRQFAYSAIGSIMQKDQGEGGGTRRNRVLNQEGRTQGFTGGKEGANIEDIQSLHSKDNERKAGIKAKRGKGNRGLDTSGHQTPYNLNDMRSAVLDMEKDAKTADKTSEEARELAKRESGVEIVKLLRDGINGQVDFKIYLTKVLSDIYQKNNDLTKSVADKEAETEINALMKQGHKSSVELLSAFKKLPIIKNLIDKSDDQDTENDNSSIVQKAVEFSQNFINLARKNFSPQEIKDKFLIGNQLSPFFKGVLSNNLGDDPTMLAAVQSEIQKMLNPGSVQTAAAAREIAPKVKNNSSLNTAKPEKTPIVPVPTEDLDTLVANNNRLGWAHHPHALQYADPEHLRAALNHFEKNGNQYKPHETASAIKNLKDALAERE